MKGQKETFDILKEKVNPDDQYIWFHAASLGEFEQGRPIIEAVKAKHPAYKILLTFFSPSGYEVRHNYELADIVCYLPLDRKSKVRKFLSLIKPKCAIFIKYEFWYNFIHELKKQDIPVYSVSSIFRKKQPFFKWYGGGMRRMLTWYKQICVQDEKSKKLLESIDIKNVTVCGDTRFDRVIEIEQQAKNIELFDLFTQNRKADQDEIMLVAGSSWPKDENVFIPYFNKNLHTRLIIAPHEINEAKLKYIEENLKRPSIRFSHATKDNIQNYDCVIIDNFGLLSRIYKYADIAYIGGGFGVGIHNIVEAAVYGVPVIFGPNFKKFKEAVDLIEAGGAYSIKNEETFTAIMDEFVQYQSTLNAAGNNARNYVKSHAGAVNKVLDIIKL